MLRSDVGNGLQAVAVIQRFHDAVRRVVKVLLDALHGGGDAGHSTGSAELFTA